MENRWHGERNVERMGSCERKRCNSRSPVRHHVMREQKSRMFNHPGSCGTHHSRYLPTSTGGSGSFMASFMATPRPGVVLHGVHLSPQECDFGLEFAQLGLHVLGIGGEVHGRQIRRRRKPLCHDQAEHCAERTMPRHGPSALGSRCLLGGSRSEERNKLDFAGLGKSAVCRPRARVARDSAQ